MILNPGSDYSTGALNGALVTLDKGKIKGHQLVRG
jgi:Icc-related predicted phosphoesterase